jgi:hypothetical protein
MGRIEHRLKATAFGPARTAKRFLMKAVFPSVLAVFTLLIAPSTAQNTARISIPRVNVSPPRAPTTSTVGTAGFPTGPTFLPHPTVLTPSNEAMARQDAWAAYNAQLHQIPTTGNPNRLAARTALVDQNRLIQAPASSRRYNFQFSDNEVRSVQRALKIRGIYSGQADGILGPDTKRAIKTYQSINKRPITGQPDAWMNASLGIL